MVWEHHEFHRLFTGAFLHVNKVHLHGNIIYLNKDCSLLEAEYGTAGFAIAIASLIASSSALEGEPDL